MKQIKPNFPTILPVLLAAFVLFGACTDERTMPSQPASPSYTETKTLLDSAAAAGQEQTVTFDLRGNAVAARLYITGFLKADDDLVQYEQYGTDIAGLKEANDNLDAQIINLGLKEGKTHADSVALDSLSGLKVANLDTIAVRASAQDSLDTYLDDRYKVSVWMQEDTSEYYPSAVLLDSVAAGYLGAETTVWGQGFYLAPPNGAQVRGKTLIIDLAKFWVADEGWGDPNGPYYHPSKPARPVATDPDQFPITGWLARMSAGSHTIHFRFAAPGTSAALTASLYLVYNTEG